MEFIYSDWMKWFRTDDTSMSIREMEAKYKRCFVENYSIKLDIQNITDIRYAINNKTWK